MSQQELVNAYLDGRISRRTLVRRLVAGGVSLGAAVSYAQMLAPERASAGITGQDHYPLVSLSVKSLDLRDVIQKQRVRVAVTTAEELSGLRMDVFGKVRRSLRLIAISGPKHFPIGQKTISVPINPEPLKDRRRAKLFVYVVDGTDNSGLPAFAATTATLRK